MEPSGSRGGKTPWRLYLCTRHVRPEQHGRHQPARGGREERRKRRKGDRGGAGGRGIRRVRLFQRGQAHAVGKSVAAQRADAHPHGRNRNALQPAAGHGVLPEAGTRAGGLHVRQPDADPGDGRRNRCSERGAGAAEHHGARPAGRGDRRRSPDGDGRDGRANGIDDRWKRTGGAALRPRGKLHCFGNRAAGGRSSGAKRQRERAGGACIRRERRL